MIAALALALSLGCSSGEPAAPRVEVPDGWRQLSECSDAFRFWVRGDLMREVARPIDSRVEALSSPVMRLDYDYGFWSSSLTDLDRYADYMEWTETVDGREARLVSFSLEPSAGLLRLFTAMAITHADLPPGSSRIRLTMFSQGIGFADREAALASFRSVEFAD